MMYEYSLPIAMTSVVTLLSIICAITPLCPCPKQTKANEFTIIHSLLIDFVMYFYSVCLFTLWVPLLFPMTNSSPH